MFCGVQVRQRFEPLKPSKMNPEELGVTRRFAPSIAQIKAPTLGAIKARGDYNYQKASGNDALASKAGEEFWKCVRQLHSFIVESQKAFKKPGTIPTMFPDTMETLRHAYLTFFNRTSHLALRSADGLSSEDAELMIARGKSVVEAEMALAKEFSARDSRGSSAQSKTVFAIELAGLPLKLELHPETGIKLKLKKSFGPITVSATSGVSHHAGGITTLIVEDARHRRVFALSGQPLSVHVPESIITTEGSVMTVRAVQR